MVGSPGRLKPPRRAGTVCAKDDPFRGEAAANDEDHEPIATATLAQPRRMSVAHLSLASGWCAPGAISVRTNGRSAMTQIAPIYNGIFAS